MTEDDDNGDEPKREERDPLTGRFLPGTRAGPGRPNGLVEFHTVIRQEAKKLGLGIEDVIGAIVRALVRQATVNGDVRAAGMILDRVCGPLPKDGVTVNVGVDGRTFHVGPPEPPGQDFPKLLAQLQETTVRLSSAYGEAEEQLDDLLQ